jgi:hypothetical protein
MGSASPLGVGELAGHIATRVAVGDVAASVVGLLAPGEPQLELGPAFAGEIEAQRDDRQALRLRLAEQLVDLGAVQEQLPLALGLVVVPVGLLERSDVGADQPGLVALDARVGIRQVDLAGADGLDLGAGQDDTGLERVLDREFVPCPAVQGDGVLGNLRAPSAVGGS